MARLKIKNPLTILLPNIISLIFYFIPLISSKYEEIENTLEFKNLTISDIRDKFKDSFFDRVSIDPKNNLVNSFYTLQKYYRKDGSEKGYYVYLNTILRIDTNPESDFKNSNSIFIKENLTEVFENPLRMIYNGKYFLFQNKYNFISFFSTGYRDDTRNIIFYSLEEGKKQLDIFNTSIDYLIGRPSYISKYDKLIYYTLSNSTTFTREELENEGRILFPCYGERNSDFYVYNNRYVLEFIEISIKTLERTRIIFQYQNEIDPVIYGYFNIWCGFFMVLRNRFAVYMGTQFIIFDLKNVTKFSHPYRRDINKYEDEKKYIFINKAKIINNPINGTELRETEPSYLIYNLYYPLIDLSKDLIDDENTEEIFAQLNLDLFVFNCFLQFFSLRNETCYYCSLLKINIEGDNSNNSNSNLYINENNSLSLIAPLNEKNNNVDMKKIILKNIEIGKEYAPEIVEVNRNWDKKRKKYIIKYFIIGLKTAEVQRISYNNIGKYFYYNFLKLEFNSNNISDVKYIIYEQKRLYFRDKKGSDIYFYDLIKFNILNIYNSSRYLLSFTSYTGPSTMPHNPYPVPYLYVSYFDNIYDSECEKKEIIISKNFDDKNINIINKIFNSIDNDIKNNDFNSEEDDEKIINTNYKIAIKFINCIFKENNYTNYTGSCGDRNIILKNNKEHVKFNSDLFYINDKLIIKEIYSSNSQNCLFHKGLYSYKYDILKIYLDEKNNTKSSKILNSCKIIIDFNNYCNIPEQEQNNNKKTDENEEEDNGNGNNESDKLSDIKNDDKNDDHKTDINDENIDIMQVSSKYLNNSFLLSIFILLIL